MDGHGAAAQIPSTSGGSHGIEAFVSVCDVEDGWPSRSHLPEGICMNSGISSSGQVGESASHFDGGFQYP